ncbi:MAG: hypothetical protein IT580_09250 [Verrucomicrobiales bacterium]|nr:hypothetical protein [Verrucomicrobiales bacterium]
MRDVESEVLQALQELEQAAAAARARPAGTPVSGGSGVLPILERIDRLAEELPASASHDLRHYLLRKSYEKARQLLEGSASVKREGRCGGPK